MAVSRVLIASLVLSLLLLHVVEAVEMANSNSGTTIVSDCGAACKARCRLASRNRRCKRYCRLCCATCNCVPPGTYGNEEVCPCYANLRTHPSNKHKCP